MKHAATTPVLCTLGNDAHRLHGLERVCAVRSLAREHHRVRPLPHCNGDVRHLCPSGGRVLNHRLQHVGGHDHRLAACPAALQSTGAPVVQGDQAVTRTAANIASRERGCNKTQDSTRSREPEGRLVALRFQKRAATRTPQGGARQASEGLETNNPTQAPSAQLLHSLFS